MDEESRAGSMGLQLERSSLMNTGHNDEHSSSASIQAVQGSGTWVEDLKRTSVSSARQWTDSAVLSLKCRASSLVLVVIHTPSIEYTDPPTAHHLSNGDTNENLHHDVWDDDLTLDAL